MNKRVLLVCKRGFLHVTGRYLLSLYLFSDTYLGLDQQFDLLLDLVPSQVLEKQAAQYDLDHF